MAAINRRFSTGLPFLDRRIDGGLEAGGLLAFTAPASSQSELLLREFLAENPTHYVTTTRPESEVRDWATAMVPTEPDLTVDHHPPEALLDNFEAVHEGFTPESFLIVDTVNSLETAERGRYLAFLNDLKALLRTTDSVGVLHCSEHAEPPPRRGLTLNRADQVWQLQLRTLSREFNNQLLITKARHGRALNEPIDLVLSDRVRIDTSRSI
jgi:hypothetical protein